MRPPDKAHAGSPVRAWRLPLPPEPNVALVRWLVHCPGVHAFWSHWLVGLVHLRDHEGCDPAFRTYPDAAYELFAFAVDPRKPVDPDGTLSLLQPPDVAEQFHGVSDERAIALVDTMVELCVQGKLAPDRDYRSAWHSILWGTIEHFTTGHPQGSA